jgi:heat shock protein HslJ
MKRDMPKAIPLSLILLALASCSVAQGRSGALANSAWQVIEIDGQRASREARIAFAGKDLTATSGCNTMNGEWRAQGKRLVVRQLIGTKMYCLTPGLMDQEQALATLLSGQPRFAVKDDTMRLRSGGHWAELRLMR